MKDFLLHLFIIIVPLFICHWMLLDSSINKKKKARGQIWFGAFAGLASVLCMLFPVSIEGVLLDLRSVPLFTAILYGGTVSGITATVFILAVRPFLGGDPVLFAFASAVHLLYCILPFIYAKRFARLPRSKKMLVSVFISLTASCIVYAGTITYLLIMEKPGQEEALKGFVLLSLMLVLSMLFVVRLKEYLTEHRRMREQMEQNEKLRLVSELAASVAHEVRNPLTAVKGFLQLTQPVAAGKQREYIRTALSELGRAEEIIGDFLSFAKPSVERVERFDAAEVIKNAAEIVIGYAHLNNVEIEVRLEPAVFIKGERSKLQQSVLNLMKNGIEAMEQGGRLDVQLLKDRHKPVCYIAIADTGKGMNEEQLRRAGTPFYTTKEKGTGLGLMVTLKLLQSMGGQAHFQSKKGQGTTVTVQLPLAVE